MGRLARTIAGLALGAVAAFLVSGDERRANAPQPQRQSASYGFTTNRPGAPTGFRFSIDFRDPSHPEGKPFSVSKFIVKLPRGAKLDDSAAPRCDASDAELYAQGANACRAASRIGGGRLVTDIGSPGDIPRESKNTVTQFNADGEIIGLAETSKPPTRAVSRTEVDGRVLTSTIPALPGFPPPDPYLAFKRLRLA